MARGAACVGNPMHQAEQYVPTAVAIAGAECRRRAAGLPVLQLLNATTRCVTTPVSRGFPGALRLCAGRSAGAVLARCFWNGGCRPSLRWEARHGLRPVCATRLVESARCSAGAKTGVSVRRGRSAVIGLLGATIFCGVGSLRPAPPGAAPRDAGRAAISQTDLQCSGARSARAGSGRCASMAEAT